MSEKLLITLEDVTMIDRREKNWEIYFLTLGYDLSGNADQLKNTYVGAEDYLGDIITSQGLKLHKWFYGTVTPIFLVPTRYKHSIPGGLHLYSAPKDEVVSFYFAIIDSDQPSRNTGKKLNEIFKNGDNPAANSLLEQIGKLLENAANLPADVLKEVMKQAFSLMINSVTTILTNNKDDLKYTNVFTFAEYNEWMPGSHDDWGNQKAKFTITSRILDTTD